MFQMHSIKIFFDSYLFFSSYFPFKIDTSWINNLILSFWPDIITVRANVINISIAIKPANIMLDPISKPKIDVNELNKFGNNNNSNNTKLEKIHTKEYLIVIRPFLSI